MSADEDRSPGPDWADIVDAYSLLLNTNRDDVHTRLEDLLIRQSTTSFREGAHLGYTSYWFCDDDDDMDNSFSVLFVNQLPGELPKDHEVSIPVLQEARAFVLTLGLRPLDFTPEEVAAHFTLVPASACAWWAFPVPLLREFPWVIRATEARKSAFAALLETAQTTKPTNFSELNRDFIEPTITSIHDMHGLQYWKFVDNARPDKTIYLIFLFDAAAEFHEDHNASELIDARDAIIEADMQPLAYTENDMLTHFPGLEPIRAWWCYTDPSPYIPTATTRAAESPPAATAPVPESPPARPSCPWWGTSPSKHPQTVRHGKQRVRTPSDEDIGMCIALEEDSRDDAMSDYHELTPDFVDSGLSQQRSHPRRAASRPRSTVSRFRATTTSTSSEYADTHAGKGSIATKSHKRVSTVFAALEAEVPADSCAEEDIITYVPRKACNVPALAASSREDGNVEMISPPSSQG